MHIGKGFFLAATVTSATFLLLGIRTLGAKPDKPDPDKPIHATDTVLVPKITLQGGQSRAARHGRQTKAGAATGVLGAECTGTRYAIIIGVSDYPGKANDLQYADDDAILMTQVLEDTYGFGGNIILLVDKGATQVSVMSAISTVRGEAGPDDEVVFIFSGHGMSGTADDGDTEKTDEAIVVNDAYNPLRLAPIWDGQLRNAFSGFQTSRIIFIFDVCLGGGMDDLAESGRVILAAATERGDAWEGPEWGGGHGEFTYYFAEGITTGAANIHDYADIGVLSNPILVTAEEAFDYAKANCVEDRPVIADGFSDDLLP